MTILSVGHEPVFVFFYEHLEVFALHHSLAFLLEYYSQIVCLGIVNPLIVNLFQLVKFLAQSLHLASLLLVLYLRQLSEVGKLRVQGEDADGRVGVRVSPGVS